MTAAVIATVPVLICQGTVHRPTGRAHLSASSGDDIGVDDEVILC